MKIKANISAVLLGVEKEVRLRLLGVGREGLTVGRQAPGENRRVTQIFEAEVRNGLRRWRAPVA